MGDRDLIAVGRIVTTHGLHGEMRVQLFNPDSTAVYEGVQVILRHHNEETTHRVQTTRPHKRVLLVTLAGCDSITGAEQLVGAEVCVDKADLPAVGPDEIYHFDLIGMQVVTTEGTSLGNVAEIIAVSSNDICVVRDGTREHLIPMIADVIKEIDRVRRRVVIEPLPGLLD